MKIAVTGACGFVGSTIVRRLLFLGYAVRAIDDLSKGKKENLPLPHGGDLEFFEDDAACDRYDGVDGIVHCAAYPDVSKNWEGDNRNRQWSQNAELTRQVLELAPRSYPVPFVLLSTCSVYGPGRVDERSPTWATSPYAASKIAAEALVASYTAAKRVAGTVLRLVNVVGPRYGHGHLADFVRNATKNGAIHALDDGYKKKSFVHVDDVADDVMLAFESGSPHLANVTSPYQWSWRDSVAVMRAMRPAKPFELTWESRPSGWLGDPEELVVTSVACRGGVRRSIVEGVSAALVDLGW